MNYKIADFFDSLHDPRRGQGQRHKLSDVLIIVIMAILSGHQGLRGFNRFAKANATKLTKVLHLKYGVPCYSTFRDILLGLEEQRVANQFIQWVKNSVPSTADDSVAFDGKVIKATTTGGNTQLQNFVSVVSAFGHSSGIIYGMKSFENGKSGEAEALRQLVEQLGLIDKVFTMDALHTQKKTFDLILAVGCHFLAQVKGNCRKLYEQIALFTAFTNPISSCQYDDNKHGYQVTRYIELYINKIQLPKGWNGITRFVKVRREGIREGKFFQEVSFYVLSKPINSAALVAKMIQEHWSIENKLHWVKDVNLGEDDMTIKEPKNAALLAYFNNTAMNILNLAGLKPNKDTFAKISNKVKQLYKLFKFNNS